MARHERGSNVEPPSARDHLANERTLLAWMRTALTVIGLGFIVDRLAVEGQPGALETLAGIGLVLFGGLIALGGGWSFVRARRELSTGSFRPGIALNLVLIAVVLLAALVLATFLVVTPP